jgi:hypothetical protein
VAARTRLGTRVHERGRREPGRGYDPSSVERPGGPRRRCCPFVRSTGWALFRGAHLQAASSPAPGERGRSPPASTRAERLPQRYDLSLPANQRKLEAVEALAQLADWAGMSLIHMAIAFVVNHPAERSSRGVRTSATPTPASRPQRSPTRPYAGAERALRAVCPDKPFRRRRCERGCAEQSNRRRVRRTPAGARRRAAALWSRTGRLPGRADRGRLIPQGGRSRPSRWNECLFGAGGFIVSDGARRRKGRPDHAAAVI